MEKLSKLLSSFMVNALILIFIVLVISTSGFTLYFIKGIDIITIILIGYYAISILVVWYLLKNKLIKKQYKILCILTIAFIGKCIWLWNYETVPASDFLTMYQAGEGILRNDFTAFQGNNYIARFPHLTVMSVYFSLIIKMFGDSLLIYKVINVIMGLLSIYMIYKITEQIFSDERLSLIAATIATLFPPFITYTGVFCTENIAIPCYLVSIYYLIKAFNADKSIRYIIISGVILSIGNLFRMMASVIVIAAVIYIAIFLKKKIAEKAKYIATFLVSFLVVLVSVNFLLKSSRITEFDLWRGSEPAATNILKGTNIQSFGQWNPEDAAIPELCDYDYEKTEEMCNRIIKERLTTTPIPVLINFYYNKFVTQWNDGDNAGVFWSEVSSDGKEQKHLVSENGRIVFQVYYLIVLILCAIGVLNKRSIRKNRIINFFFIMFGGYIAAYLLTENQPRYAYIVSWILIFIAILGIEFILSDFKYKCTEIRKKILTKTRKLD